MKSLDNSIHFSCFTPCSVFVYLMKYSHVYGELFLVCIMLQGCGLSRTYSVKVKQEPGVTGVCHWNYVHTVFIEQHVLTVSALSHTCTVL